MKNIAIFLAVNSIVFYVFIFIGLSSDSENIDTIIGIFVILELFVFLYTLIRYIIVPLRKWIHSEPEPVPVKVPPIVAYLKAVQEAKEIKQVEKQHKKNAEILIASMGPHPNFQLCFQLIPSSDSDCEQVIFISKFGGIVEVKPTVGLLDEMRYYRGERNKRTVEQGKELIRWTSYTFKEDGFADTKTHSIYTHKKGVITMEAESDGHNNLYDGQVFFTIKYVGLQVQCNEDILECTYTESHKSIAVRQITENLKLEEPFVDLQDCFKIISSETENLDYVIFVGDFGKKIIIRRDEGKILSRNCWNIIPDWTKKEVINCGDEIIKWDSRGNYPYKPYILCAPKQGLVSINNEVVGDKGYSGDIKLKPNQVLFTIEYGEVFDNYVKEKTEIAEKIEKQKIANKIKERHRKRQLEKEVRQELIDSGELFGDKVERPRLSRETVDAIYRRDGGKCVYCGSLENLQLDHIIPFSKGGATTLENMQLLCQKCNLEKSNKIG